MRSAGNMSGYYKQPDLTAEVLSEDGWLKTGDVGEIDERGHLRITGRIKEIFKTEKGKYVAPAPIENRLGSQPGVELACVIGSNMAQPVALLNLTPRSRRNWARGPRRTISPSPWKSCWSGSTSSWTPRAAQLPGDLQNALDRGERPDHAHPQAQAQRDRKALRGGPAGVGQIRGVIWEH